MKGYFLKFMIYDKAYMQLATKRNGDNDGVFIEEQSDPRIARQIVRELNTETRHERHTLLTRPLWPLVDWLDEYSDGIALQLYARQPHGVDWYRVGGVCKTPADLLEQHELLYLVDGFDARAVLWDVAKARPIEAIFDFEIDAINIADERARFEIAWENSVSPFATSDNYEDAAVIALDTLLRKYPTSPVCNWLAEANNAMPAAKLYELLRLLGAYGCIESPKIIDTRAADVVVPLPV